MTTIRFFRTHGRISGFSCQGHSGYAEAGEDIVCAAVTSAIRLVECTLNDVQDLGAPFHVDDEAAEISLSLPQGASRGQDILQGMFLYMRELSREYPYHLTVLEV
jgi:uncharacterized protein YsxB (DUF464 family)